MTTPLRNCQAAETAHRIARCAKSYFPRRRARPIAYSLGLVAITTLLCSCMTVGRAYVSPAPGSLVLGTAQTNVLAAVGPAKTTVNKVTPNGVFQVYQYYLVHASLRGGVGRALNVEFLNGALHGYIEVQVATEGANQEAFDKWGRVPSTERSRVEALKSSGKNLTKADLLNALGEPNGKALRYSTLTFFGNRTLTAAETWAWNVSTPFKGNESKASMAFAQLDSDGRVTVLDLEDVVPDGQ